jgi:hypothetical protein
MRFKWLQNLFEAPTSGVATDRLLKISRYGIGFCPGCKRLRSVASLRCADCSSEAPVVEDH